MIDDCGMHEIMMAFSGWAWEAGCLVLAWVAWSVDVGSGSVTI